MSVTGLALRPQERLAESLGAYERQFGAATFEVQSRARIKDHGDLKLDADNARKLSPAFMTPATRAPVMTCVGGDESSEFQRQNALLGERWRAALFVQDEWRIGDAYRWLIVPAARLDHDSQFGGRTTGNAAWGMAIGEQWRVTAGVGTVGAQTPPAPGPDQEFG